MVYARAQDVGNRIDAGKSCAPSIGRHCAALRTTIPGLSYSYSNLPSHLLSLPPPAPAFAAVAAAEAPFVVQDDDAYALRDLGAGHHRQSPSAPSPPVPRLTVTRRSVCTSYSPSPMRSTVAQLPYPISPSRLLAPKDIRHTRKAFRKTVMLLLRPPYRLARPTLLLYSWRATEIFLE